MSIKIIRTDGINNSIDKVIIQCDLCEKQLDGKDVYMFDLSKERESVPYFACHNTKGFQCHDILEEKLKEVLSTDYLSWNHLHKFPLYLAYNTDIISKEQATVLTKEIDKHKENKAD